MNGRQASTQLYDKCGKTCGCHHQPSHMHQLLYFGHGTELAFGSSAFWAVAIVCVGHKGLLRVVANENSKDWVVSLPDAIATHHSNSSFSVGMNQI